MLPFGNGLFSSDLRDDKRLANPISLGPPTRGDLSSLNSTLTLWVMHTGAL